MLRRTIILLVLLVAPALALAQPCGPPAAGPVAVTSSSTLCFEPSEDHNANDVAGVPKVTSYAWGHYLPGAAMPVSEWGLGKPTPVNGAIRVKPLELMSIPLEVMYEAKVVAIGPSGRGVSAPSGPFYRSGAPAAPPGFPVWIPGL